MCNTVNALNSGITKSKMKYQEHAIFGPVEQKEGERKKNIQEEEDMRRMIKNEKRKELKKEGAG